MRKRKFSSYGPVDNELHYHVPRTALRNYAYNQLIGENPDKGGHFVTVWAPRQTGKTWLLNQVGFRIKKMHDFDIVNMSVGLLKDIEDAD
jgi:predicted AAA+ superfamily ATPase